MARRLLAAVLAVLPLLAACGSASGASPSPTEDLHIVISGRGIAGDVQPTPLPTLTPPPGQTQPGGQDVPGAGPAPALVQPTAPPATPTVSSSQFPYAAPTTLTVSSFATANAPAFAAAATASFEALPPTPVLNIGQNAPPLPPPAAAASTPTPSSSAVTVSITDSGFSPATVNVRVGGMVTWTDTGQQVHTATQAPGTSPIGPGMILSTVGIGPGQSASLTFLNPGTYAYTSATDCLNGNHTPSFGCGQTYTVVVTE